MPLTDENGKTGAGDLQLGLYLLAETKVPEYVTETVDPWFAALPFTDPEGERWLYDLTCYPKNQTGNPTLEKFVQNAGENVDGTDKNTKILRRPPQLPREMCSTTCWYPKCPISRVRPPT